jgi:8-oxo-dGTP pyrophosphatase MutT (NUDIX family)
MNTGSGGPLVQPSALAVTAIIESVDGRVLMQIRKRPGIEPEYDDTWEFPQGRIEPFENVYEALIREVSEETGLTITGFKDSPQSKTYTPKDDAAFAFKPFCGQQQLKVNNGRPWVGFVFICEANGELKAQVDEVSGFKWFTKTELEELLKTPEKVFTYNLGTLELYLKS